MSEHHKGQGVGWIHFAGIFFLVAAVFNAIAAVSILTRDELFDDSKLVVADLQTWGWVFLVVGVVQLVAGIVVLRRLRAGRVPAIIIAVVGMVAWFVVFLDPAVLGPRDDDPLRPHRLRPHGVPRVLRVTLDV